MSVGVGIDLGAGSATAVAVRHRRGSLSLMAYVHVPHAELKDEGVDVTSVEAVSKALVQKMQKRRVPTRGAVVGVSGKDAIIRYSHLPPMPAWRLQFLMELEIADMAEKTGEALSADFRVLSESGDGSMVLVALAKDAQVLEAVEALQRQDVELSGASPVPVAVGDAYRFLGEGGESEVVMVLDIGRSSTQVCLVELGELVFARSVAVGGDAFIDRLTKAYGVSRLEAEEVLATGRAPTGEEIDDAIEPARQQLSSLVRASLDFARSQLKRKRMGVQRVVVCGGGSRIPGLAEELGGTLDCEGEAFDPLTCLDLDPADRASKEDAERYGPEATTALGLALSAVLPGATKLDLLPLSIKEALRFRHRTVPMLAAGVVVGAAAALNLGFALWERGGQRTRAQTLAQTQAAVSTRLADHEELVTRNDQRQAELQSLSDRARAGLHMASLLRSIAERIPEPIHLRNLQLERDDDGVVTFVIEGVATSAEGDGLGAVTELADALRADPRVASARVRPTETEGSSLTFMLEVVPVGNPVAAEDA